MYADDDEDTTPPPRPKRFTISYAQVAKHIVTLQNTSTNPQPPTSQVSTTNTTTTATSTITQESLEEALQHFRQETNTTITSFKNDIQKEITSIEDRITAAMLTALRTAPREITTVNETSESSACTKESQQTISTLVDKVDSLADTITLLARSVEILQQENSQKRNRLSAISTMPPTPDDTEMPDSESSSPPLKQPRARAPSPMLPRPPKVHPLQQLTIGAR
jgi:chromosome segregation ATPase